MLSISDIKTHGYFVGIAVSSHSNDIATLDVANIQLTRTCSSHTITHLQCEQASNCVWGGASETCYNKGEEVPDWEFRESVASIFDLGSTVTSFGCDNEDTDNRATDGTTVKFYCQRTGSATTGLLITPFHNRLSIAHGLRVYAANNCPSCDPVSYIFEGRTNASSDWVMIGQGDLPWKDSSNDGNNVLGLDISSTYKNGDSTIAHTEVSFSNVLYYMQYRLTWTDTRNSNSNKLQFSEIEVPGLLAEKKTMATHGYAGDYVSSILDISAGVSYFGSFHVNSDMHQLVDQTTNKFVLNREGHLSETPGVVVTPTHGRMSLVSGMRIYTPNNNPGADPMKYAIQGRHQSGSGVQDRMDDKCWELSPLDGNKIILTESCDDSNPNQRFYMTANNEIRVNGVPDYCLNMRLNGKPIGTVLMIS